VKRVALFVAKVATESLSLTWRTVAIALHRHQPNVKLRHESRHYGIDGRHGGSIARVEFRDIGNEIAR
jgi:hypothetical protein